MGNVIRMWENRLEPREIPRKLDPRPTEEIISTLVSELNEFQFEKASDDIQNKYVVDMDDPLFPCRTE